MGAKRTSARPLPHVLFVRTPIGLWPVKCPPVHALDLAVRLALALRSFLRQPDVEFTAAARWAFQARDAIADAGLDRERCAVLVARAGRSGRALAEFAVADDPAVVAGRVGA